MFQALVLEKNPDFSAQVREVGDDFLPDGDVTVDIDCSTLNFKDGLAITNRSPVVRSCVPKVLAIVTTAFRPSDLRSR